MPHISAEPAGVVTPESCANVSLLSTCTRKMSWPCGVMLLDVSTLVYCPGFARSGRTNLNGPDPPKLLQGTRFPAASNISSISVHRPLRRESVSLKVNGGRLLPVLSKYANGRS